MKPKKRAPEQPKGFMVQGLAPDLGLPSKACLVEGTPDPSLLVIFGASGDLSTRKLIPALYSLHLQGGLPQRFAILGCSRKPWGPEQFQEAAGKALRSNYRLDESTWQGFSRLLHHQRISYEDFNSYKKLAEKIAELDRLLGIGGNRIFHLAVPPSLYETIAQMLGQAGLGNEGPSRRGWCRIVVEKPFGRDLASAQSLNSTLLGWFGEHQIFRIDHYLAKETVQNILVLRFANEILEPLWSRAHVQHVGILAAEDMGVERRAGYYEQAGVLRDMFQNHMLQLLSLVAMEPPALFASDRVRDEKVKVFRSLRYWGEEGHENDLILGQYTGGTMQGNPVPGYREEEGVHPQSLTPTFAAMRLFVDNWRWQGVPFYLASGKRMARKLTEISIQFREVPHSMFQGLLGQPVLANRLVLKIHPEEKLVLTFQSKNPGAQLCLRPVTMEFDYYSNYTGPRLDAYEKLLLDCLRGDQMLFWRQDAIEVAWGLMGPILDACESCSDRRRRLFFYPAGTWGPKEAWPLMAKLLPENPWGRSF